MEGLNLTFCHSNGPYTAVTLTVEHPKLVDYHSSNEFFLCTFYFALEQAHSWFAVLSERIGGPYNVSLLACLCGGVCTNASTAAMHVEQVSYCR